MTTELQHNIVVAGHMNPAIHHPAWYRELGLISPTEAEKAQERPDLVVSPHLARVVMGPLTVQCLPETWRVSVTSPEDEDRALDLAIRTFGRLDETPIQAFGMNYQAGKMLRTATQLSLAAYLKEAPYSIPVSESAPGLESLTLTYAMDPLRESQGFRAERTFRSGVTIQQIPNGIRFQLSINVHHQLVGEGHFDLGEFLHQGALVRSVVQAHVDAIFDRVD